MVKVTLIGCNCFLLLLLISTCLFQAITGHGKYNCHGRHDYFKGGIHLQYRHQSCANWQPIKCNKKGFFIDKTDCKRFYRCVDFNNRRWGGCGGRRCHHHRHHKLSLFCFTCPNDGTIFDPRLLVCSHPSWVNPPPKCLINERLTTRQPPVITSTSPLRPKTTVKPTPPPTIITKPTTTRSPVRPVSTLQPPTTLLPGG